MYLVLPNYKSVSREMETYTARVGAINVDTRQIKSTSRFIDSNLSEADIIMRHIREDTCQRAPSPQPRTPAHCKRRASKCVVRVCRLEKRVISREL